MQRHAESCRENLFPICLGQTLSNMFGDNGKKFLDSIVMNETFRINPLSSFSDVWMIYEKYMERIANIMGKDVAEVIEFQTIKQMKGTECPLYEKVSGKFEAAKAPFMNRESKPTTPSLANR